MIPLGLYCVGETFQPGELEADLPAIAKNGGNAIYVTHKSAADTAIISRAAQPLGIRVVAALKELDGSVPWQRQRSAEQIEMLVDNTLDAWGDAPGPLAWGMCDEPKTEWMSELRSYINSWCRVAGNPVMTLPSWAHLESASEIGCEVQGHFLYPFRRDGTSGYGVSQHQAWLQSCADNVRLNVEPWAFGQCFANRDVYRYPTPQEVAWQAYSAIAIGCRGFFGFCWDRNGGAEGRISLRCGEMWAQWSTLGSAFTRIAKFWPIINSATTAEWRQPVGPSGSVITRYTTPNGRYVYVVAGPDATLTVSTGYRLLQDIEGPWWKLSLGTVTVPAGSAALLRVIL